jgi:hypothetical protein
LSQSTYFLYQLKIRIQLMLAASVQRWYYRESLSALRGVLVNRAVGIVWVTMLCAALAACGGGGSHSGSRVLTVSQTTLTFSAVFGIANDPVPAMVNVTNTGTGGALNFTAVSDSSWLMVAPASGATPGTLTVTAVLGSLTVGTYTGHITVTATGVQGSPATITVTFMVNPQAANTPFWPSGEVIRSTPAW